MIGMMYLVLTALLALNISKEILNGFIKVEHGLLRTQETLKEKCNDTFNEIYERQKNNPARALPYYLAAEEVQKNSLEVRKYLQTVKAKTIAAVVAGAKKCHQWHGH